MKRPPQIPISDSDWQRTPTAVQVLVVSSSERVGQLEQVVEQQAARVASLEEELARRKGRSRRGARAASSKSGASSSRTEASRRRSSGRSPGGQPGHEGHGRSWVPVEQVDELIPVKPSTCHGCGHPLTGDDPHPQRHQEVVIPPLRAEVIEYQVHTLRCAHCDRLTAAGWPEGVSRHTFGPSVQAWVSLLAGAYRLSKRNIRALLSDAFGLEVSLGTVSRLEQEVAAALAAPVEEARAFVRRQGIVNVDETGWRQRRAKAWLWTAVTEGVTVFSICPSRGRDGVDEMLGADNRAVVGSDRYSAYAHLPLRRRQVCWAHLRRAFEEFVARGGEAERVGHHLLDRSEQLFTWWHQVRGRYPCPGPASKTISTICVCAFGFICAMGSGSPTPRRRPPAPISSTSGRPCGPSHAGPASSRPTTRPNEPFAMACCGVTPASAPTVPKAAVS